jgi:hypothetical protein
VCREIYTAVKHAKASNGGGAAKKVWHSIVKAVRVATRKAPSPRLIDSQQITHENRKISRMEKV